MRFRRRACLADERVLKLRGKSAEDLGGLYLLTLTFFAKRAKNGYNGGRPKIVEATKIPAVRGARETVGLGGPESSTHVRGDQNGGRA